MVELTTVFHHSDLSQILRDVEGRGDSFSLSLTVEGREVTMDDYLCLPSWTGTVVTKGGPIPEDHRPLKCTIDPLPPNSIILKNSSLQQDVEKPNPKFVNAREKKERQALLRIKAKMFDEDGLEGPQKKKKFRPVYKKRSEGDSGSERKDIEILKVDLSDPTKERTPSMNETVQEETSTGHENSPPNNEQPFDVLSHLVTPVEDAILAGLSNYKVLRRIYESLSRSTLAQAELLKRFEQLNHDYLDCQPSCRMEMTTEKDEWKQPCTIHVDKIKNLEGDCDNPSSQPEAPKAALQSPEQAPLSHVPALEDIILDVDMPLQERARFTTPSHGFEIRESSAATAARQPGSTLARDTELDFMTALEEVKESVTDIASRHRHDSEEFYMRHQDAQDDRAVLRAYISTLARERRYYCHMAIVAYREAMYARHAWTHSMDHIRESQAEIRVLQAETRALQQQRRDDHDMWTRAIGRI
ncbi:hypothetical protein Tco_0923888 [Tanacetum coccineum]|uniref:Uncharacterized protein n=1 Tax=Tanacetum coccineum TaxID=301880 RepID=A0ABQ5D3A5_9ASTR